MSRRPIPRGKTHPYIVRLRQIREDLDLTQREVARRIGTHPNNLCKWEMGSNRPGFEDLSQWAKALGVDDPLQPPLFVHVTPRRRMLISKMERQDEQHLSADTIRGK